MNGQNFAFNGYLPKDQSERIKKIQFLEHLSFKNNQTQIFIETPFRNSHLIQDLGHHCHPNTYIAIATDLTTETQQIMCQQAKELKKQNLQLKKRPTVFLIHKY